MRQDRVNATPAQPPVERDDRRRGSHRSCEGLCGPRRMFSAAVTHEACNLVGGSEGDADRTPTARHAPPTFAHSAPAQPRPNNDPARPTPPLRLARHEHRGARGGERGWPGRARDRFPGNAVTGMKRRCRRRSFAYWAEAAESLAITGSVSGSASRLRACTGSTPKTFDRTHSTIT